MDRRFFQLLAILLVAAVGYSVLSTPGSYLAIDVGRLKQILLYLLLGASAYAVYLTLRPPRRPPGV